MVGGFLFAAWPGSAIMSAASDAAFIPQTTARTGFTA
jgi:hypothetical protein